MSIIRTILPVIFVASAPSMVAAADTSETCENAARNAEHKHVLPNGLLQAITRVETNRGTEENPTAWPWTVNTDGEGHWFNSRNEAEQFVKEKQFSGSNSIDIGCFQINTKWHGDKFGSVDAMFDPKGAAEYAAKFLNSLKLEKGDWKAAVAAYHSRLPEKSKRYSQKVTKVFSELNEENPDEVIKVVERSFGATSATREESLRAGVSLLIFNKSTPLNGSPLPDPIVNMNAVVPLVAGKSKNRG